MFTWVASVYLDFSGDVCFVFLLRRFFLFSIFIANVGSKSIRSSISSMIYTLYELHHCMKQVLLAFTYIE